VHVHLWERNADAVFVEGEFDFAHQGPVGGPIIGAFHPRPYDKVDRAAVQRLHLDVPSGVFQNTLVGGQHAFQHFLGFVQVGAIRHANEQIDAAQFLAVVNW